MTQKQQPHRATIGSVAIAVTTLILLCACHEGRPADRPMTTSADGPSSPTTFSNQPSDTAMRASGYIPNGMGNSGGAFSGSTGTTTITSSDVTAPAPNPPRSLPDDDAIQQKIQAKIAHASELSGTAQRIRVDVEGDRIVMRGDVLSEEERQKVITMVRAIAGERRIDDRLSVL